ncbi:MAG: DUF2917 domain-containing protein [Spirochaetes bacterium]|nr:DUF2917 domain-containing protein [Spirochaetota bacterium]
MKILLDKNELFVYSPKSKDMNQLRVFCHSGLLHITQKGDMQDRMLFSHQSYLINKKGKIVIEALKPASFNLLTESVSLQENQYKVKLTSMADCSA